MRLDKFLADENFGSRKTVGALIRSGAVSVNGQAVKKADTQLDPARDAVCVNGKPVRYAEHIYLMMNKPAGVLTATRDSRAKTVLDLLPPALYRRGLFPAGRLDRDTTGLLILTDDGDYAHRMLAPKSHVWKRYEAVLDLPADAADTARFAAGIQSGENLFAPAVLEIDSADPRRAFVQIREGKFHQVKRMFKACGKTVVALSRLQIGALPLDASLEPGQAREMTPEEADRVFL